MDTSASLPPDMLSNSNKIALHIPSRTPHISNHSERNS